MNLIKITITIALTLWMIGCSSVTKEYTFSLLAVDEERAMNVKGMSQKDAEALGDIILTDKRDVNIKYLVKAKSILDNSMIINAKASINEFPHARNDYLINLHLSEEGTKIFSDFTAKNVGNRMAIVLNSKVYATPIIAEQIKGGMVPITGDFSKEKAFEIVNAINLKK